MTANDLPSLPELRLLRRLRTLQNGMHLCIIHVDVNGIASLSIIGNGKLEKVRRIADIIDRDKPGPGLQEHS